MKVLTTNRILRYLFAHCIFFLVFANTVKSGQVAVEVSVENRSIPLPDTAGRIVVAFSSGEKRPSFLDVMPPCNPMFGITVPKIEYDRVFRLADPTVSFPKDTSLGSLPPGKYRVQSLFVANGPVNHPNAPGNLRSAVETVTIGDHQQTIKLKLTHVVKPRSLPQRDGYEFQEIPSPLLTEFHKRPISIRVGVALPLPATQEPGGTPNALEAKNYGLIVHIGGFGQRCTSVFGIERDNRFVQILLDGAGPFGDPYYVDSANNGPYGQALIREVIPHIEKTYHCKANGKSRFTTGTSTGGWVSMALQIYYPEIFNGCWSSCPDGVDFRNFELIDIYSQENAYIDSDGTEIPAMRTKNGDPVYSVRHECQLERVLGGGRWEWGAQQWGSWNAVYGPKGIDGPIPLWDGETGRINRDVVDYWKSYDLRLQLEKNWPSLGPKLNGKLHVWVGTQDEYYLNLAVERLKRSTEGFTNPPFDGEIIIEEGKGHVVGWTARDIRDAMFARMNE